MGRREDLREIDAALMRVGRIGRGRAATRLRAEVSGVELTNAAAGILSALHQHGPMRVAALAEAAATEPPLVSRELRALDGLGFVVVEPDPDDGRGRVVTLTAAGKDAYERFRDAADRITAHAFRGWSDDDVALLRSLVQRVVSDFAATGPPD